MRLFNRLADHYLVFVDEIEACCKIRVDVMTYSNFDVADKTPVESVDGIDCVGSSINYEVASFTADEEIGSIICYGVDAALFNFH